MIGQFTVVTPPQLEGNINELLVKKAVQPIVLTAKENLEELTILKDLKPTKNKERKHPKKKNLDASEKTEPVSGRNTIIVLVLVDTSLQNKTVSNWRKYIEKGADYLKDIIFLIETIKLISETMF